MEQLLRNKIEEMIGYKPVTPREFTWLCETVMQRTHERVSGSTLRRFWGYANEGVKASTFTKDVLARFLCFSDFAQFVESNGRGEMQSLIVTGSDIKADSLYVGQMLRLSWLPDRTCVIRHEGEGRFVVVEAENTRLSVGDTFECSLFINHEPAFLGNWRHGTSKPCIYAIGKKDGILVEKLKEVEI